MRSTATALLLVAAALGVGACGGSDEGDIEDIIQNVAKDSATICDHATDKLLAELGSGGVEGCQEAARAYPDDDPDEVSGDIDIKVDGDSATADFTDNDGDKQHVVFVKEDGDWLIDEVTQP